MWLTILSSFTASPICRLPLLICITGPSVGHTHYTMWKGRARGTPQARLDRPFSLDGVLDAVDEVRPAAAENHQHQDDGGQLQPCGLH